MVAPTCFDITLPSSGSVPRAFWDMLNWGAVDRILWMGVLCLVTWCVRAHHVTTRPSTIFYLLFLHLFIPAVTLTSQGTQLSSCSLRKNKWLISNGITVTYRLITIWAIKAKWLRSRDAKHAVTPVVKFMNVSLPWAYRELTVSWVWVGT
jgi:hypothetical protein